MHVALDSRWSMVARFDAGSRTIGTTSRAAPTTPAPSLAQRTTLDLTSMLSAGVQVVAWRWRGVTHADARSRSDRARLVGGAGGGRAQYRLRQWGTFVDADRRIAYNDEYRSASRDFVAYATAGVEVPLGAGVAIDGQLRRQWGSAEMNGDYDSFDRIDIGGTTLTAGIRFTPSRWF